MHCTRARFSMGIFLFTVAILSFAGSKTPTSLSNTRYFPKKMAGQFYIQVGSFLNKANAYRFEKNMHTETDLPVSVHPNHGFYIVALGPFNSAAEVGATLHQLQGQPASPHKAEKKLAKPIHSIPQ